MNVKAKVLDDKIKEERVTHDLGQESAKISALKSGNIDKYEYLTGQEVIPTGKEADLAHAKFEYSPLGKAFEKQVKTIKEQGEKQVKAIENTLVPMQQKPSTDYSHLPPNQLKKAMEDRYREIQNLEGQIEGNLKYDKKHTLEDVSRGPVLIRNIYLGNKSLEEAEAEQSKLIGKLANLKKGTPKNPEKIQQKEMYMRNAGHVLDSREKVLKAFRSGLFPTKEGGKKETMAEMEKIMEPLIEEPNDDPEKTIVADPDMPPLESDEEETLAKQGKGFDLSSILGPMGIPDPHKIKKLLEDKIAGKGMKVMTPRQMLQRLPIAMAQVKAGNNSETLLNEIRQMLYSLYRADQITKQIYENLMKTI